MADPTQFRQLLWAANTGVEILLLVVLGVRRNYRGYPAFTFYIALNLTQAAILYATYRRWGFSSVALWRCGLCAAVFRLGSQASVETGAVKRGPRIGTVDRRRDRSSFSFCALLRCAHRAHRPPAGYRSLPVLLFPRAERYNSRAISKCLRNAMERFGVAGVFREFVALDLGASEITSRDCRRRRSSPPGRLSNDCAADQPAIAIAK